MKKTVMNIKAFMMACMLMCATASLAANGIWNGTTDGFWTNSANWSANPYPSGTDTASFTNSGSGQTLISVDGLISIRNITFDTPSVAAYTIGTSTIQTLVLGGSGVITLTDTAATSQVFQAGLQLGGDRSTGSYTINNLNTNQTLTFNNVFGAASGGTAGAKTLTISGAGNTSILGSLAKGGATSMTLTDTSSGKATVMGTNTFVAVNMNGTGTLALTGSNTVTTLNMNGGASSVVDIGSGFLELNNGGGTSFTSSQGGTINGTGTLWFKNQGDNSVAAGKTLVINAPISSDGIFEYYGVGNTGTFVFNATNTFPGEVQFNVAGAISVWKVGNKGAIDSNLGKGTTINFNANATPGAKLIYTGTGEDSDRTLLLNYSAILDHSGTGLLKFTAPLTASGNPKTLTLQGSTSGIGEIASAIPNNAGTALAKNGSGMWILSGTNLYPGATTVNGGTLLINSPGSVVSPITVNKSGLLGGNGTINGSVTLATGGLLAPAKLNTFGTLSITNALTLNGNALFFDIDASNVSTDKVAVAGAMTVNGTNTVYLSIAGGSVNAGTNTLITFGSQSGSGSFVLAPGYANGYLLMDATSLSLVVTNTGIYGLSWKGNESTVWDLVTANWTNGNAAVTYTEGESVTFDDTASNFNVTGDTAVNPGSVVFNNSANAYTVSAAIAGATELYKFGTGTTTLSGTNTYSGQTTINGGKLTIGGAGLLGNGSYSADIANAGVFEYASSAAQTHSGVLIGNGALIVSGNGILTLSGTNTYTGETMINAGKLKIQNNSGLGTVAAGTEVAFGATLELAGDITTPAEALTLKGTLSSQTGTNIYGGVVTLPVANASINVGADSMLSLNAFQANGAYTKEGSGWLKLLVDPNGLGLMTINNGVAELAQATGATESDIVINSGGTLLATIANPINDVNKVTVNAGGVYDLRQSDTISSLNGTGLGLVTNGNTGAVTLTVGGNNGSGSFSGVIENGSGMLGLTKIGTGIQTLSGANTYTGLTTVTAGTLSLRGPTALPALSDVSMNAATLQVLQDGSGNNGTISVGNNITLNAGITATIDVGDNGSGNTGNTVAFGALNNGPLATQYQSTINFTGTSGYLQSFTSLGLSSGTGQGTTLKPTTTSVTILGNVLNRQASGGYDTLTLDGTSTGNSILGCISDSAHYTAVNNGDTRVTKSSTSTWTLSGVNTYRGPTTVSAGTLIIGGAGKLGGGVHTGTLAANGGLFNYASSEAQVLSGVISGAGTIIKTGTGTLTLTAVNTFSGTLTNNNGILRAVVGGSCTGGSVMLAAATGNSASLEVGVTDITKQWTCANLTVANAGVSTDLDFDFGTLTPSTTLAPLKVTNVVTFTTTPTVTVKGSNITGGPGTVYPLMTWISTSGTAPTAVTVTSSLRPITAHLTVAGSTLNLVIDSNGGPLLWASSGAGTWNTNSANTVWLDSLGAFTAYSEAILPGDTVFFSDSNLVADTTVTLDSIVTPGGLSVTNDVYQYTISGSGGIAGPVGLIKSGTNILTLATANTYSGGTVLSSGKLALGNAAGLPLGSTLSMSGIATLDLNGSSATIGNISTSTTGNTITDSSSGTDTNTLSLLNQSATISALIKDGPTKKIAVNLMNANVGNTPLLLTAASTFSGGFTLKNGASLGAGTRLCINGAVAKVGSPGNITSSPFGRGPIIIGEAATDKAGMYITTATTIDNELIVNTSLGTDQPYAIRVDVSTMNLSGKVTANTNLTMASYTTGSVTLTNEISGVGGVTMPAGVGTLTATLTGPNTYLGKTIVNKGTLYFSSIKNVGGGASALGAPTTIGNGTIDVSGDLRYTGTATSSDRIINLLGNCTLYGSANGTLTLNGGFTGGANSQLSFRGDNNTIVINGLVAHNGSLSRTDTSVLFLNNNANSFTGNVNISKGTISVGSIANKDVNCALGAGKAITLGQSGYSNTGTLQFTGASGGASDRDLFIQSNAAQLTGGVIENTVAGQTLTLSGNLTASPGSGTVPQLWLTGAGNGVLSGIIGGTGLVSVTKSGAGTWTLRGANTNRGPTLINGGTLSLSGANGGLTNSSAYTIASGAMLLLENTAAANNTNRLRDASAITLDNGTLCFTNTAGAASYYENAGALFVTNSGGTIVSAQADVGRTNILSLGTLTRTGSATLNFVAPGLGASDRNRIFIAGQAPGLIGLWATINTTNYAAYDSTLGVIVAGAGVSFTNILAKGPSIIPDDPALNAWINEEGTEGGISLAAAVTNRIKTLVQNTDWLATIAMTNKTLLVNEVLVSTGNARALTLGTTVGEGAIAPLSAGGELLLTAAATDSLLTVNASISNNATASTVTKQGLGTVVLAGTNIFTGNLNVNSGTLLASGSNALAGAVVNVGGVPGDAVVKISSGSSLVGSGNMTVGNVNNGNGALYLDGGNIARTGGSNERNFALGTATGGYGYFNMSGGGLSSQRFALGVNAGVATSIARITGGVSRFTEYLLISRSNGGIGVMTIDSGEVYHTSASQNMAIGFDGGRGELNMTGGLLDNTGKPLTVRQNNTGIATGIVNLCSGTLIVDSFLNTAGTALLNFNGGLLKAGATSTTFLPATMTGVYVNGPFGANAGGAKIDSAGKEITFVAPLIAPPGSGVTAISLSTQGSGYIGEPYVSITGDGVGATAVANMADDGTGNGTYKVASVTVTTPGVNYTSATVSFLKGGATAVAPTVDSVTFATTAPAGLTKLGLGTLTLSGTNTYAGATTISNGTLKLGIANALPTNSVVNVNGGIYDLGGFTVTNGQVNVTSGLIKNGTIGNSGITVDETATMTTRIGSQGLTKNGNGTLVLNGPVDNFSTGPLVVNSGTVKLSFGPLNADLSYWLDATDLSKLTLANTNVTAWADSSTNGVNFAQGTSANQPVYVSNVINGLPALRFSGNQKMVASKTVNAQTVFIVNTPRGYSTLAGIWGATPDTGIRLASATSWSFPGNAGDFTTGTGQMFINGIAGNTFVASTPQLLTAVSATQRTGWSTMIGNYYTGRWFNGDIGELLVYNSALGATDRQSVEAYLLSKWFGVPSVTGLNVSLADGTFLDLGGGSVTVTNLTGSGTVSNGTLSVTGDLSPAGTNIIGTLTAKANTTLSGKLVADVATDGTCDLLDVQGNLTLLSPTLEIVDLQGLSTIKVYTLATCSGTLTGTFTTTNLPDRWALRYTTDGKVQLYYKGGTMVRIL